MPNFKPNPIDLSGVSNARDYAGYPTKNGCIKPKKLLRGAHLHRMTEADKNKLKDKYGVVHIIDLRTSIEIEQHPNLPLGCGNTYHFNVIGDNSKLSADPEEMLKIIMKSDDPNNYLSSLYQDFVRLQSAQNAYSELFDVLLKETEHATYWHCTAGKDRTGFAGALILCALGADYELVMADFLLSNVYRKTANAAIMARICASENEKHERLSEAALNAIQAALTVKQAYLENAFSVIQTEYGGIDHYLNDVLGMTPEKCARLRSIYLSN